MAERIVILKTNLLQKCKDFFAVNNLNPMRWIVDQQGNEVITSRNPPFIFTADVNKPETPDGYQITIFDSANNLKKPIIIPPGRMVLIDYHAGYIWSISCILPLRPLKFTAAMDLAENISEMFENTNWQVKRKITNLQENNFGVDTFGTRENYSQLTSKTGVPSEVDITLYAFNSMPGIAFTTALTASESADAPSTYLVSLSFTLAFEVDSELTDLMYKRNLIINGDKRKFLPVRIWFDDPEWRPAGWSGKWITID